MAIVRGTSRDDFLFGDFGKVNKIFGFGGDDVLYGSLSADNFVYGGGGNDSIDGGVEDNHFYGGAGKDNLRLFFTPDADGVDELYGGRGSDRLTATNLDGGGEVLLDGGSGADVMEGGGGRDIYVVDSTRDRIVETFVSFLQNDPRDEVKSDVSWRLARRLEDLILTGNRETSGIGNADANEIAGNRKANVLKGLDGRDILDGDSGDDIIYGGKDADRIAGDAGGDRLYGRNGEDRVTGGSGADRLYGGSGADRFIFTSAAESGRGALRDRIGDFSDRADHIDLSRIDADTEAARSQAFTFIGGDGFSNTAGELRFSSGSLRGDVDGDGTTDVQIQLTGLLSLDEGRLLL